MLGARGFLKREGFDFDKKPNQLDKAFLKLFSVEEAERIQQIWASMHLLGGSPIELYSVPTKLQQAHLLMSHDRERYLATFDWIRNQVGELQPASVIEMGCGTGVLLRYLAANFPEMIFKGIDTEPALINVAPANSSISLLQGDYLAMSADSKSDLIICNFGFDSDNFEASKTPHSIDQIGQSKFCPGCSDDLAVQMTEYLTAWRKWGTPEATLLMVGRMPNFGFLRAVQIAGQNAKWSIELGASDVLRVKNLDGMIETFPALTFGPAAAIGNANMEDLEFFYQSTAK